MRKGLPASPAPGHLGLAYASWAKTDSDGKVPDGERSKWFTDLGGISIAPAYRHAFELWRSSFTPPAALICELQCRSRLLVGHGNTGAADVGIQVHHTWGVPIIPGTALKGVLAHYIEAVYGPDDPDLPPSRQPPSEVERVHYQGPTRRGSKVIRGPGSIYRALLGAPPADDDGSSEHDSESAASAGLIVYHDALYVPGSSEGDRPFAVDVTTVHQKTYYDSEGGEWANDYDSPNPVSFITVRPGVRMLLVVSGPPPWTSLAQRLLVDALGAWGVGAKTSAGYGRLAPAEAASSFANPRALPTQKYRVGDKITVTRVEDTARRAKARVKFQADDGVPGYFSNEDPPKVAVGDTVQTWVSQAGPGSYALTLRVREPRSKKLKR